MAADIEWHWHKHFNITFYNYINLPDGSIFDGNGHSITVDHIQGYNSATGVYEHYLYDTGVTLSILGADYNSGNHPGAMQNGIFKIPEFSSTTVQTSKGVIIKNLKMDGTAPTRNYGERFFWNSQFGDYGEDGTGSYGVGAHPSLNIFKYRSEDGFGRLDRAVNVKLENLYINAWRPVSTTAYTKISMSTTVVCKWSLARSKWNI